MIRVRVNSITRSYFHSRNAVNKFAECAESLGSAESLGVKYYVGSHCKNGCLFVDDNDNKVNGSVRYTNGRACIECSRKRGQSRRLIHSSGASKRIEDIKLAKELGISVDELE